jgi:SAM-dependent methyltransferase
MLNNLIINFKRLIISSSFFWKIRQYVQPEWINSYDKKITNIYLLDFVSNNKISSVLDFGCATGSFLYDLKKKNSNTLCYGIDINLEALKVCNNKFKELDLSKKTYFFNLSTDEKSINTFCYTNRITNFDLIVFDRVLYCLSESELNNQFGILTNYAKLILIDDFQINNDFDVQGYKHRDWISIMSSFNFECEINIPTIYSQVDKANPRTLVFKNLALTES